MNSMIDKKLNVYFVNKETGKTFFNNVMFGNVQNVGTGCVVVFPIEPPAHKFKHVGTEIDPNDYHVIPGYLIELIYYTTEQAAVRLLSKSISSAESYSTIERKIKTDMFPEISGKIYLDLFGHYEGLGE